MDPCPYDEDEILEFCRRGSAYHRLSQENAGRKVMQVSSSLAVKFGLGVTLQEAESQRFAFDNLNHEIVRIARVHHFFTREDPTFGLVGYLVMEHIDGVNLEQIDWDKLGLAQRIVAVLNELNSITHPCPGPVSGGEAHGCLWSEYGSGRAFQDIQQLEAYLNERLSHFGQSIHLRQEDLRFCHLDATPRNFMIDLQGRLCLLDWANAGFFPRYFELWSLEFAQHVMGQSFGDALSEGLRMTPAEALELPKLTLVYRYNSHFATDLSNDETGAIMASVVKADARDPLTST